ncbi:MAG: hypothetical protein VB090_09655 [Petrimonas sp.]|nr:hypothetical protein [Petrimonas sp.]
MTIVESFIRLKNYCEAQDFAGWEPYDGLNSKVFRTLPFFKRSASCRMASPNITKTGFTRLISVARDNCSWYCRNQASTATGNT